MCPGSIQNTRRKKIAFNYHYRTGFMVKLIKVHGMPLTLMERMVSPPKVYM